jgi:predicted nucleic acid-binding protein
VLLREPASEEALASIARADTSTTASIAYVEVRAAVAGAARAGRISRRQLERTRRLLHEWWAGFEVIETTDEVIHAAGEVAERYGLRAGDAIHLTAAIVLSDVAVLTFDRELRRAALEAGLEVIVVG